MRLKSESPSARLDRLKLEAEAVSVSWAEEKLLYPPEASLMMGVPGTRFWMGEQGDKSVYLGSYFEEQRKHRFSFETLVSTWAIRTQAIYWLQVLPNSVNIIPPKGPRRLSYRFWQVWAYREVCRLLKTPYGACTKCLGPMSDPIMVTHYGRWGTDGDGWPGRKETGYTVTTRCLDCDFVLEDTVERFNLPLFHLSRWFGGQRREDRIRCFVERGFSSNPVATLRELRDFLDPTYIY